MFIVDSRYTVHSYGGYSNSYCYIWLRTVCSYCMFTFLAQRRSCDGCISTRICRATTGKYLLQFTKLFDQSLLAGDCGLHFTNHLLPNGTLTEEMCVELLPNFNYSILCPICYPNTRDIHYEIPIFNIENCSSSGILRKYT